MPDKKERYIPSIRTLKKAAESLPPAQTWRSETVHVPVHDDRLVEFKKVRFKTKEGRSERWVYEGKVIVTG
jgi:hypothetical protein